MWYYKLNKLFIVNQLALNYEKIKFIQCNIANQIIWIYE